MPSRKLSPDDVLFAELLIECGETRGRICEEFGVARRTLRMAMHPEKLEAHRVYGSKWAAENPDKVSKPDPAKVAEWRRRKRAEDPNYKLAWMLRVRLRDALKGNRKNGSAVRDLGCTVAELREWIEAQWYDHPETGDPMTWDNWTIDGWHIDHVRPLASFDLEAPEQLMEACSFWNLQPLWAAENLRKGDHHIGT